MTDHSRKYTLPWNNLPSFTGTRRRTRVLALIPSLREGGAERVFVTLLQHLDRSRFEPHLGLLQLEGPFLSEVPADVPLHNLRASQVRYSPPAVLRAVWKLRPDVLLTTMAHLNKAVLLIRHGFPPNTRVIVRQNLSVAPLLSVGISFRRWAFERIYRLADRVICQSDHMVTELNEGIHLPRERLLRIYNPVDELAIAARARSETPVFQGPGPHLVAAGRLELAKGHDVLLRATAEVRRSFPTADLTIFGTGPLERELKLLAESLGIASAVRFLGFKSNPFPYYRDADVFVHTSRIEGLPNALLEAAALDAPIMATCCPGGVAEILRGLPAVWLAPQVDPVSVAKALSECLHALSTGRRHGNSQVLSKVSLSSVVRQYESVLANSASQLDSSNAL